jgi:hypothetical protein
MTGCASVIHILVNYVCFPLFLHQMCGDGGRWSEAAIEQLIAAGYNGAVVLEGGYAGWGEVRN